MNNKKYKTTVSIVATLTLLAGGLFAYDNIYLTKKEQANLVPVYLAKHDIQAYTEVDKDMFNVVGVHKESVLPSYVTNIENIEGQSTIGAILKDEPLTKQRLATENKQKEGDFSLKVEPDFIGDLSKGDTVKVFVQLVNPKTKETTVKVLFDQKQVKKVVSPDNVVIDGILQSGVKIGSISINATEDELESYYNAKQSGYIIVAKYEMLDVNEVVSTQVEENKGSEQKSEVTDVKETSEGKEKFEPNSKEAIESERIFDQEEGEAMAVMSYVVQEGETIDTLSIKFKTSVEQLTLMNEQKSEFVTGETITVPAE